MPILCVCLPFYLCVFVCKLTNQIVVWLTPLKPFPKLCLKSSIYHCVYTQKNFFTTLSIIQENFNYKIKYSQDYLVNKIILYQFEDIVTILRILFHQIDIKLSCIQEKPTSTLFYGYNFSVCNRKSKGTQFFLSVTRKTQYNNIEALQRGVRKKRG